MDFSIGKQSLATIDRLRRSSGNGGELPDCPGIVAALEAVTLSLKYRYTLH